MDAETIAQKFAVPGRVINVRPFGNGLINDTFIAAFSHDEKQVKYILRKINRSVFKNPRFVIENGMRVSAHIQRKLLDSGFQDTGRRALTFFCTAENLPYYIDGNNDYWSMISYIHDAYTKEVADTAVSAYEAAKAFGAFQNMIWDAGISSYHTTITGFHDLNRRLQQFDDACSKDRLGRCGSAAAELNMARQFRYINAEICAVLSEGSMPLRITHNDTKINNVMLDNVTSRGLCVIDLDTVMPGYVIFDFGDMVRSFTNSAGEEGKNISAVHMRKDIFQALCRGYIPEIHDLLCDAEKQNLLLGARAIIYEQSVRFLTDYIAGDVYYSAKHPKHNLVRAVNQLSLLSSMEQQLEDMQRILNSCL